MRTLRRLGKALLCLGLAACPESELIKTSDATGTARAVVTTPADRSTSPGRSVVLGTGWYANVEVDSQDRVHLAWTDADRGDVLYAVSPPGKVSPLAISEVETLGAVGGNLRLALAPGDIPVLLYFHQDRRMLRVAHLATDLEPLLALGGEFDEGPEVATEPEVEEVLPERLDPTRGMAPGWIGEDVAFGDGAGGGGSFRIDEQGRPHIVYYRAQERLRYVRRPPSIPAFGPAARAIWEKIDVDDVAGGSHTMSTDLLTLKDHTVVVSYAHWNYTDSQLKIAVLDPGATRFRVSPATKLSGRIDGWHSSMIERDGFIDVYATSFGERKLWRARFTPGALAPLEIHDVLGYPGAVSVAAAPNGDVFVLSRTQGSGSTPAGVYLVTLPGGERKGAQRLLLERSAPRDSWLDLAVRRDGRPVAVWTSRDTRALKAHAP